MVDYEKKYKDAMGMAEEIIRYYKEHNRGDENSIEDLEGIFPELKESEDEKIRKGLIKALSSIGKRNWGGIDVFESIAWLEKQGESYTKKDVDDAYLKGICDAKHELDKQGTPVKLDEKQIQTAKDKMFPYQENVGRSYEQAWAASGFELGAHFVLNRLNNNGYSDEIYKQGEFDTFDAPQTPIKDAVEVTSRMPFISDDMKPIAEFIMGYANWDLHKDEWNQPTLTVPLFRVLDALIQRGKPYGECSQNIEKQGEQKPFDYESANIQQKDFAQKPTEWSDEDDIYLQDCIGAIWAADYYLYEDKQDMEAWLKSLKDRIGK